MSQKYTWDVSRRSFLVASAGLLMPKLAWVETQSPPGLFWSLDGEGDTTRESVHGSEDPIASRTGHAIWVGEGRDRALRLDGYSVWIEHNSPQLHFRRGPLTIAAWVALESYPVTDAALVQQGKKPNDGFCLSIDRWGYLHIGAQLGSGWKVCSSDRPVPRARWTHLAATIDESGRLALYRDGSPSSELAAAGTNIESADSAEMFIGKSVDGPVIGGVFPTGVLNALIKDVRIYEAQLSRASIVQMLDDRKPEKAPDLQINGPWCSDDKQRPLYHAMPPRAWTNEPHGLIYWQGQYHLFYQKNANGPYWGNINWGHMTSPDLYRWTEMPVALSPEHGVDSEGCWSGSVIDHEGKLALIYTGGNGHRSSICLACSSDGIHFAKYEGNPIISAPPQGGNYPEFRDPFIWREEGAYYLIAGSAVQGVGGTALLYRSEDLIHWEFRKALLIGDRETSGVFWEMPIFIKVGDKHVLIVCEVPGRSSYWVGTWKDERFTPLSKEPRRLELFNHLLSPTPHTTSEGDVITMGIIPDQRSPKECWRAGWAHLYSLPRTLSVDANERLQQQPFAGIEKWSEPAISRSRVALTEETVVPLEGPSGTCVNIRAILKKGSSRSVSLFLRRSPDDRERTVLRYEWEIGRLVLDRSKSSLDANVVRDVQETTYFPPKDDSIDLTVFLDESVLEVFLDRQAAFASRIYPTLDNSNGLAIRCDGGNAEAETVTISRMRRPFKEMQ